MRKSSILLGGLVGVAIAALVGLTGCSQCESCKVGGAEGEVHAATTGAAAAGTGVALAAGSKRAVFAVEGMTCEGCASGIMAALQGVPGVQSAGVEYKSGEAWAVFKADVAEAALVAAVEKHGYKATVKSVTGG